MTQVGNLKQRCDFEGIISTELCEIILTIELYEVILKFEIRCTVMIIKCGV